MAAGVATFSRQWPFLEGRYRLVDMVEHLLPMSDEIMYARLKNSRVRLSFRRSDKLGVLLYALADAEPNVFRFLSLAMKSASQKAPLLVDLGANIGLVSLRLAAETGCKTISVEPQPGVKDFLEANAKLNGLESQVRLVPHAVGDSSGETFFYVNHRHPASSSMRETPDSQKVHVQIKRLDEMVSRDEWLQAAVMKVDIEGYEREAFLGATGLFETALPPVVFEVNFAALAERGQTPRDVSEPLRQAGYKHFHALGDVLYPPENGVSYLVDVVATTDAHESLRQAYGCDANFRPKPHRHFPLTPMEL